MLYNKLRPQTIDTLSSTTPKIIVDTLLSNNEIPSVVIFSGPAGSGKTTLSRLWAKKIMYNFLDKKVGFEYINLEEYSYIEVNSGSTSSVNDIRIIQDQIQYSGLYPHIIYFDEFHGLSSSAKTAMLKTLEDPPPNSYFIISTTEKKSLNEMIKSRGLVFDIPKPTLNIKQIFADEVLAKVNLATDIPKTIKLNKVLASNSNNFREIISNVEKLSVYQTITLKELSHLITEDEVNVIKSFNSNVYNQLNIVELIKLIYKIEKDDLIMLYNYIINWSVKQIATKETVEERRRFCALLIKCFKNSSPNKTDMIASLAEVYLND